MLKTSPRTRAAPARSEAARLSLLSPQPPCMSGNPLAIFFLSRRRRFMADASRSA